MSATEAIQWAQLLTGDDHRAMSYIAEITWLNSRHVVTPEESHRKRWLQGELMKLGYKQANT